MKASRLLVSSLVLGLVAAMFGCVVPKSRLNLVETRNRSLDGQRNALLAENANLKVHCRNIEDQLARTEENLALLEEEAGLDRFAGRSDADVRRE